MIGIANMTTYRHMALNILHTPVHWNIYAIPFFTYIFSHYIYRLWLQTNRNDNLGFTSDHKYTHREITTFHLICDSTNGGNCSNMSHIFQFENILNEFVENLGREKLRRTNLGTKMLKIESIHKWMSSKHKQNRNEKAFAQNRFELNWNVSV